MYRFRDIARVYEIDAHVTKNDLELFFPLNTTVELTYGVRSLWLSLYITSCILAHVARRGWWRVLRVGWEPLSCSVDVLETISVWSLLQINRSQRTSADCESVSKAEPTAFFLSVDLLTVGLFLVGLWEKHCWCDDAHTAKHCYFISDDITKL